MGNLFGFFKAGRIGTWNVRTLQGAGKLEQLEREMSRYNMNMVAVTETHLPGEGEIKLGEGSSYTLVYSGLQDERRSEGVGIAMTKEAKASMRSYHPVSARVLSAEFQTQVGPLLVIVVYAPTNQHSNEEKDEFYNDLDNTISRGNGLVMIMGDFNAAISESVPGVSGTHALSNNTSDNGYRLISFASTHGLCIMNTFFEHKHIHLATWYPPDPKAYPSVKDYILVKQRMKPSIVDTRVYRGGDMDSDHRLLVAMVKIRLMRTKCNRNRPTEHLYDANLLQLDPKKEEFAESFSHTFEHRTRQGGYEQRWSEVKNAILHTAKGTLKKKWKKRKKWITESTLELSEKKRNAFLIWQEDRKNEHKRKEYRELCKYVR